MPCSECKKNIDLSNEDYYRCNFDLSCGFAVHAACHVRDKPPEIEAERELFDFLVKQ